MASSISDGPLLAGEVEPDSGMPRWSSLSGLAVVLAGVTLVSALHPTLPHLGGTPAPYAMGEPAFGRLGAILPPAPPTVPTPAVAARPAAPSPVVRSVLRSVPVGPGAPTAQHRAGQRVPAARVTAARVPAARVPVRPQVTSPGPAAPVTSARVAAARVTPAPAPARVTAPGSPAATSPTRGHGRGHVKSGRPGKGPRRG